MLLIYSPEFCYVLFMNTDTKNQKYCDIQGKMLQRSIFKPLKSGILQKWSIKHPLAEQNFAVCGSFPMVVLFLIVLISCCSVMYKRQ